MLPAHSTPVFSCDSAIVYDKPELPQSHIQFSIIAEGVYTLFEKGMTGELVAQLCVIAGSKQTTFLERGFALCPPEGGIPSGPS